MGFLWFIQVSKACALMVFLKEFLEKLILKKISRRRKSKENYHIGKYLTAATDNIRGPINNSVHHNHLT